MAENNDRVNQLVRSDRRLMVWMIVKELKQGVSSDHLGAGAGDAQSLHRRRDLDFAIRPRNLKLEDLNFTQP
ncbi:hypothetical protein Pmani_003039 [Petrolisthes manimaculis]|uniref:Uncharacterized protein n=1 Tax=Petrolisthes manimaculis TaxID=1843537 RepID=A0AAE1QJ99_9EUCA|nr:hypothetical protein Pmani_003039 [Petrolisthes manimaculis]